MRLKTAERKSVIPVYTCVAFLRSPATLYRCHRSPAHTRLVPEQLRAYRRQRQLARAVTAPRGGNAHPALYRPALTVRNYNAPNEPVRNGRSPESWCRRSATSFFWIKTLLAPLSACQISTERALDRRAVAGETLVRPDKYFATAPRQMALR